MKGQDRTGACTVPVSDELGTRVGLRRPRYRHLQVDRAEHGSCAHFFQSRFYLMFLPQKSIPYSKKVMASFISHFSLRSLLFQPRFQPKKWKSLATDSLLALPQKFVLLALHKAKRLFLCRLTGIRIRESLYSHFSSALRWISLNEGASGKRWKISRAHILQPATLRMVKKIVANILFDTNPNGWFRMDRQTNLRVTTLTIKGAFSWLIIKHI